MNELEDIKLKAILQEMKLNSPDADFSVRVMNKIFQEGDVLEKIKSERVLGKGFWIIIVLFVILMIVISIVSNTVVQTDNQITELLPNVNSVVGSGYNMFFEKAGKAPLSIAGILLASSVLLFIERIISSNSKIFLTQ